ncbi:hypothetical protein GOODEAATRI_007210, partial [Goodea atripinnis]
ATYDPSHGYSPQPIDILHMALSRDLQPIVSRAKPEMLKSHFIPTMEKLKKRTSKVVAEEDHLRMEGKSEGDEEDGTIRDEFAVLCRDLYALYPLLIRYVDNNRARWLTSPDPDAEELFRMVGEVFIFWSKSHVSLFIWPLNTTGGGSDTERTKKKKRGDRYSVQTSLIVAALKKMLPIGLNMCSPADQELINLAKVRYSLVDNPSMRWQMALYKVMAGKAEDADAPVKVVKRVQEVSASCHIGEEEEVGDEMMEQSEDEMSFEVRQSELVMGGQGLGTRNTAER